MKAFIRQSNDLQVKVCQTSCLSEIKALVNVIPWALRKISGRKAIGGSILAPVPKPGLRWHLSLYIQILSFLRGRSFPGRPSSLSPQGMPICTRQSSSCLGSSAIPSQVPCSGCQLMAQARGAHHRALPGHHTPPPDMPGKTRKQGSVSWAILLPRTLICAGPTARTPKSETQRCQSSCYAIPSVCSWCQQFLLSASSPTAGVLRGSQHFALRNGLVIWEQDPAKAKSFQFSCALAGSLTHCDSDTASY